MKACWEVIVIWRCREYWSQHPSTTTLTYSYCSGIKKSPIHHLSILMWRGRCVLGALLCVEFHSRHSTFKYASSREVEYVFITACVSRGANACGLGTWAPLLCRSVFRFDDIFIFKKRMCRTPYLPFAQNIHQHAFATSSYFSFRHILKFSA